MWEYGTEPGYMKSLVHYWLTRYDWRVHERALNRFHHYRARLEGIDIHFIHERARGAGKGFPLLVLHGWPGSVCEFEGVVGPLADPAAFGGSPADAFDLVVPSLPGYGFSGPTHERGVTVQRIADLLARLMTEVLGYDRFGVQGGDWGAVIASRLGFAHADKVAAIHLNMIGVAPHPEDRQDLTPEERRWLREMEEWRREETGYQWIQGTRPQTLAFGLSDSPVGLAAWIVEKFRAWSDCDGDLGRRYSPDQLLTNIMIYWVTQTIHSSCRLYCEMRRRPWRLGRGERIGVPTGVAVFPKELARPPRRWAERAYNIARWTEMPRGGHFAALEEPELFVGDVREFFREWRE
jgi:microsomal epoxide hydrolase